MTLSLRQLETHQGEVRSKLAQATELRADGHRELAGDAAREHLQFELKVNYLGDDGEEAKAFVITSLARAAIGYYEDAATTVSGHDDFSTNHQFVDLTRRNVGKAFGVISESRFRAETPEDARMLRRLYGVARAVDNRDVEKAKTALTDAQRPA